MIRVYTKEQAELLSKHLGFPTLLRFESFLAGDYDLTDDRSDGLEDNAAIVEADKAYFDSKIGELKNEVAYNGSAPTEEQILKVISMVKQLNVYILIRMVKE